MLKSYLISICKTPYFYQVDLSFDLGDPCIAVCHPSVLALFSDNFDLQNLDALTSEILESDLVDSTVYMERLEGRAISRVVSPHSLLEVEQRLLERWFHPQVFIKDAQTNNDACVQVVDRPSSRISMARHSVYKGRDATLGGGVLLKEGVLVSPGSKVGFLLHKLLIKSRDRSLFQHDVALQM